MENVTSGTEQNFDARSTGQSSTSKYVQANTPPVNGNGYGANKISGTPDDVTIKPNLKKATVETKSFAAAGGLLASLMSALAALPLPLPFKTTTEKKEIAEPAPTSSKAQYGKISVNDSNGFVEIKDNTPGNKIWTHLHPSGTYDSVSNNGDVLEKSTHDRILIVINDWNITVSGDELMVIDGDNKIQIKKDRQININGNDNLNIDGNTNTNIGKDSGLQVGGNVTESITGNMTSEINQSLTEAVKKNYNHTVNGSETNTVMKDRTDVVAGSLSVVVSGNAIVHVGKNANISSGGIMTLAAPEIDMNAPLINLNGNVKVLGTFDME